MPGSNLLTISSCLQVFMTRRDLNCIHEPFGDAFYFGPERLSDRYEKDEKERIDSGFANSTYKTIFDQLDKEAAEVRAFFPLSYVQFCSVLFNSTAPRHIEPAPVNLLQG